MALRDVGKAQKDWQKLAIIFKSLNLLTAFHVWRPLPFVFVLIVNSDLKWKFSPNFSFFFSSVHCYLSFPLSLLPGAVGLALDADWQYEGENIPPFSFSVNCVFSHCASLLTPANLTEMVIVGYVCQSLYCQFLPFLLHLTLFIHLSFPRYNSAGLQNHFLSL